jgi:hypothetical protein
MTEDAQACLLPGFFFFFHLVFFSEKYYGSHTAYILLYRMP